MIDDLQREIHRLRYELAKQRRRGWKYGPAGSAATGKVSLYDGNIIATATSGWQSSTNIAGESWRKVPWSTTGGGNTNSSDISIDSFGNISFAQKGWYHYTSTIMVEGRGNKSFAHYYGKNLATGSFSDTFWQELETFQILYPLTITGIHKVKTPATDTMSTSITCSSQGNGDQTAQNVQLAKLQIFRIADSFDLDPDDILA